MIVTLNGVPVDYDTCENLMDNEIREDLHQEIAPCTNQYFLDRYIIAHKNKYNQDFTI